MATKETLLITPMMSRTPFAATDQTCLGDKCSGSDFSKTLDSADTASNAATKALNGLMAKQLAQTLAGTPNMLGAKPSFASGTWREMLVDELAKNLDIKFI
jgi:hypothetical protein